MRVGIYGGSFDPVHNGHINAAQTFFEELSLDRLIVVPAYCSPFKKGLAVTPSQHRMNMCKIAFGNIKDFEVSDIEILREDEGYMSDTIDQIKEQYPDDELFLLVGGDQLLILKRWHAFDKIAESAKIAVTERNWDDTSAIEAEAAVLRSLGAEVTVVPIDVKELSSTAVREAVRRGDDISSMVPSGVAEYIWNNYLYY